MIKPMNKIARAVATIALAFLGLTSASAEAWKYESETDKMSGKVERTAHLVSTNSLDLQFPYSGPNYGHLVVRQHPEWGLDVYFSVNKGQLMCRRYSPCKIKVKFDDDAPITFNGSPPDDLDSKFAFLSSPKNFIAKAQKAKTILVQLTIYRNGVNTLEFNVESPLVWDKKPAAKGK